MISNLTLRKALDMAVATEQVGARFYQRMAEKFSNTEKLAGIFNQLAKDEQVHEKQFKEIAEQVPKEEDNRPDDQRMHYLRAAASSEFFEEGAFEDLGKIRTETDALGMAFRFEKDTLFFYFAVKDSLGQQNEALDKIIEAEKDHVSTLMKVITTDAKFRSLQEKWH